jgi:hypothetical protein
MEILVVIVSIIFGVIVGRYVLPFVGAEIGILHTEIDLLHVKVDALIGQLKKML